MTVVRLPVDLSRMAEAAGLEPVSREWFTAAELAELGLPGLPRDKRSLNRRAREERWQFRADSSGTPLSRPRLGRGGGTEFHISLLPGTARIELARRGMADAGPAKAEPAASGSWRWYECQSATTKDEASRRAAIMAEIALLEESGMTRTAAVAETARQRGVGSSTLWTWLKLIEGVARADWLPALAPRRRGGGKEAEIHPLIWTMFKSDFLRLSGASMASCYERAAEKAAELGVPMPHPRTFDRRLERDVDPRVVMLRRKGEEALRRSLPSQRRTVAELHALEWVNIDGHKFDVFVRTADGRVIRPMMVALQDVYSRKVVAWRLAETENTIPIRLAFSDLFANYGIPVHCLLDNGRGFASKWISGGAKTRFRFKIKPEEPTGILTGLGIQIHWALPFRGQSKPIERSFKDMCDRIARHPAMEGAYCGNSPMAKPENYGSRAIDWDVFVAHVAKGIAAHNARLGRRTEIARGRSFDEAFAESYATAPISRATPEQLRMALLAAEQRRVNSRTGEVELAGNRYWSDGCAQIHGQLVTVRFDPDNLHQDVHLYGLDGRYITAAQLIADTGFSDSAAAKAAAKKLADYRRRIRDAADAEQLMAADELTRLLADAPEAPVLPEPSVIRPVRHRGQTAAALKTSEAPQPQQRASESRMFAALGRLKVVE